MLKAIIQQVKLFYSSSGLVRGLIGRITASGPYYLITKAWVSRQTKKSPRGPFNLVIETSSICNARCVMCPFPAMQRSKKVMTQDTFEKIVAQVKKERLRINKVFFSGLGEPLVDPKIISRLKVFKDLGFRVKLYTNASLLTREIAKQLVALELDEMNISFNGVTPEQYQKVMGLDFSKTVANINALLEARNAVRSRLPNIRISSIITKENEEDIEKHIQNWSDKADSVTVSLPHEWGGAIDITSETRITKSKRTYPCRSLWHTFMIDSNGDFAVCCRDHESRYVLGNINRHSFSDVQKSPVMNRFRRLNLGYSREKLPKICRNCNFPYQAGVELYLPRSTD